MNWSLRTHLSSQEYNLPQNVIDEVCTMFSEWATNILDGLSNLEPKVRGVALNALRDYYNTIEYKNKPIFTQVAQVMAHWDTANESQYKEAA
jgi:hypothetical protein